MERTLTTPGDWDDPATPKLWRYNAHYFDDLNATGAPERAHWHAALFRRWLADNAPTKGSGWEPYPVSLRVTNWVKWCLHGGQLPDECIHSLAIQTRWLRSRLEWHLLGNHLFANAKALAFAGCFFAGQESADWMRTATSILAAQLDEQVLADGGHFELSPMYHALALEDVLDLINLSRVYPGQLPPKLVRQLCAKAGAMLRWSAALTHPDGQIAFFNDAVLGVAPAPDELSRYAARTGVTMDAPLRDLVVLETSGFVRAERGPAVLLADVGRVGPDYLPGHAHADTLSFELSLWGRRWVVNTGCSEYDVGSIRLAERGTAAHNTVVVDGQDSSEVWSAFRVARRAEPFGLVVERRDADISVSAAHDGYRRLPGRVTHRRHWQLSEGGLTLTDQLDGGWSTAAAHLHLHPDIRARSAAPNRVELTDGSHTVGVVVEGGEVSLVPSSWHPEFGVTRRNTRLVVAARMSVLRTRIHFGR